jgi:DNA replication licensing factor MCM7
VRAQHIGQLVTVTGIVTRCSEVKPLLLWATYTCDVCGWDSYQRITHKTFMPLTVCPVCAAQKKYGSLVLQTRGSKFVKFQDVRIQELAEQVPIGHVPRTMTVHVTGELTRLCAPGDTVTIHGVSLTQHSTAQHNTTQHKTHLHSVHSFAFTPPTNSLIH